MKTINQIIEQFQLEPLTPEGGYFRRIYESPLLGTSERRYAASIYYLLEAPDFSCFHRLDCDELWHFYAGAKLALHQISPEGELTTSILGDPIYLSDTIPFAIVKKGNWFAAEIVELEGFAFVGCTTIPEFQFSTFEAGKRSTLSETFPMHKKLIAKLTRE